MAKGVNLSGAFNRKDNPLAQLPEKPLRLGANFFRKLVRRIETIVPTQNEDNNDILIEKPASMSAPGLIIKLNARRFELNVCNNGVPDTIVVYGPQDQDT